jgi:hypothetical protein
MNYSTDPVADAAAYYEPRYGADEAQAKAERQAGDAFMAECGRCDANALADFAPMVRDWTFKVASIDKAPKRVQTLAEVMQESLDYPSGPCMEELMQLLLNVAYGCEVANAPAQARRLIERMASTWASQNVTVED